MRNKSYENGNVPLPLVSVIIPVFERQAMAEAALQSVLAQTEQRFEIILVDDGSSEKFHLPEALGKDRRIRLYRHHTNRGASAARNTGANKAHGAWLAWLDSDDIWHPHKLEMQLNYISTKSFTTQSNIVLATGFNYHDATGLSAARVPMPSSDLQDFLSGCWFCPGSTVMISADRFRCSESYDVKLNRLEDLDWFASFCLAGGRVEVVDQVLVTITRGHKPAYVVIRHSGEKLLRKWEIAGTGEKMLRRLRAYLELEYASSAIIREKRVVTGALHLLKSLMYAPRVSLHLSRFWRNGDYAK